MTVPVRHAAFGHEIGGMFGYAEDNVWDEEMFKEANAQLPHYASAVQQAAIALGLTVWGR